MNVLNVHERVLDATLADAGTLVDSLGHRTGSLWPERWPPMRLDGPLAPGTRAGHTPIRYIVESYEPGRRVRFRFTAPRGFDGFHMFEIEQEPAGGVRIRHTLAMRARGIAMLTWPLVFRPLHDALIEDAFDRAQRSFGPLASESRWSARVRFLRWLLRTVRLRGGRRTVTGREIS